MLVTLFVPGEPWRTLSVRSAEPPAARSGTEHVTTAPAVLQPLAGSAVASAGRVVATLTPVAVSGPALRTLRRYSAASPSTTGSGAPASVTDRSACGASAAASHPYARGSRSSTVAVSLPLPQSMSASRRPSRARTASLPAPARSASQPAPPSSTSLPPRPASASSAPLPTSSSAPAPPLTPWTLETSSPSPGAPSSAPPASVTLTAPPRAE